VEWLWDFDDDKIRKGWDSLPYRKLFEYTCKEIEDRFDDMETFKRSFFHCFLKNSWLLPNCSSSKFWQKLPGKQYRWLVVSNHFLWKNPRAFDNLSSREIRVLAREHLSYKTEKWVLGRHLIPIRSPPLNEPYHSLKIREVIQRLEGRVNAYKALQNSFGTESFLKFSWR
jgi:hypothetical protein